MTFMLVIGSAMLYYAGAVTLDGVAVKDDIRVRMPGTQPEQNVNLEAPNRCLNCHSGYNQGVEPGFNWMGSMMAQSARDPIFWACLTVSAQDSIWAIQSPNATDICLRCHFPEGWLGGRSDPTNASAMIGSDFDGLHCDFCHRMWDPFTEATHSGAREGNDWIGYWDEAGSLSQTEANATHGEDSTLATGITTFAGTPFYANNLPRFPDYLESTSGQYFVSPNSQKRASFADAAARHQMLYSRTHKSKYFCGTCHDVSNPVLANLGLSGLPSNGTNLITEQYSASRYFHVERTFSEFMLSAYGQPGGAATNAEFRDQGAPDITWVSKCQDCHMRDVRGVAANKNNAVFRPGDSTAHPNSGLPLHDLTGGNAWISYVLASLDPNGPVFDQVNADLLDQGPAILTLDLGAGQSPKQNWEALLAGSERAKQQLRLAATIKNLSYDSGTGALSFRIQNNSGHKLISGFPEGRRMFVNIKSYDSSGTVISEVNPYSDSVGTLKSLNPAAPLGPGESYRDDLVYEVHPRSDLTSEEKTFHFVLATGRSKDNRIPPKGFNSSQAAERHSEPVDTTYTADEYGGGFDEVNLNVSPGAAKVEVRLYYQGTSREYIEFLRDEINGTGNLTLPPNGDGSSPYIAQTHPFFAQLKAWGNVIWRLWAHNHGMAVDGLPAGPRVDGVVPFEMTQAAWPAVVPCAAPVPTLLTAVPGNTTVALTWSDAHTADPDVTGYTVYYDQAGKSQLVAEVGLVTSYNDTGLTNGQLYSYKVTSRTAACESAFSNILSATPDTQGQLHAGVNLIETGYYSGMGKNTVFVVATTLVAGDTVVIRATVVDRNGVAVPGAVVDLALSGPETALLTTGPSDANGIAEAAWQTKATHKKTGGGTTPGLYTVTTTGVTAGGYAWDGVMTTTSFVLE